MTLLSGRELAADIRARTAAAAAALAILRHPPRLSVVTATDDEASAWYVRSIAAAAAKAGIVCEVEDLGPEATADGITAQLSALSADPTVAGIILTTPLPGGMRLPELAEAIDPAKDVDGANPSSLGRLMTGLPAFAPATAEAVLRLLESSRTGRAWRAVREDPLAAASMTIPVNRVKLAAFAAGAVVAGLAGTLYAAQQASVFPTDFDTPILILIYAGLILGGAGSIAGACLGALVVMVIYDGLLRSPAESGYLFYGLILLTLLAKLRPWRRLAGVLAATVALGLAAHAIAKAISASAVAGGPQSGGWIADALRDWVIVPAKAQPAGNWGFVVLVCVLITLVQVSSRWRTILLPPTLFLASFVWETTLVVQPSVTRQLMIGAILIVMMNARPQGLLGQRRVEALT